MVTGLDLATSLGALPAPPTRVAVNLGNGPQVRELDEDSTGIELTPHLTDRVQLTLVDHDDMIDRTILGFSKETPPGLAEITVLGEDGPIGAQDSIYDRVVTVECEAGPVITIEGRTYRTSVTGSVRDLAEGAEVPATLCDTDAVGMSPGRIDVDVEPGTAFVASSCSCRS